MAVAEPKRIVCAVDFSEGSHHALHVAIELARKAQAVLILLHVEERPLWLSEPFVHLPGDLRHEQIVKAERELAAWQLEAQRRGAAEVITRLTSGVPWDRIVSFARSDPRIDLVVLGTHGRTGITHVLLGSVAERVVRHAPCSVMVVRPHPEATADSHDSPRT